MKKSITLKNKSNSKSSQKKSITSSQQKSDSLLQSNSNIPKSLTLTEEVNSNFDEKSYTKLLKQISLKLNFGNQKSLLPTKKIKTNPFEKSDIFLYDNTLLKQLEIEINLNVGTRILLNNLDKLKEFFTEENFEFYEYSNSKTNSITKLSAIDNIFYEGMYKKDYLYNNKNILYKFQKIDQFQALSSLYNYYYTNKTFFYILTRLHCFYFDLKNNNKNTLFLSNMLLLEKDLKDNEIEYNKIENKNVIEKIDSDIEIIDDFEDINKIKKENINNNMEIIDEEENDNKYDNNPICIKGRFVTHFFNVFIKNNIGGSFNIFTPYKFENSVYKTNKIYIDSCSKDSNNHVINIKMKGIIFPEYLKKIIDYISKEYKSFNMKFDSIKTSNSFYNLNSKLKKPIEKIEFKDNYYLFK